ncbi:hypothetical protein Z043_125448 [Scleropages formosus]|uniref:Arylsulfatase A-like n=1 Tax=Scleropages formosus TaxID=113540 RepID=A0A0P7XVG8_SCLFO|nr:hypothetical protein Z043_125448 [Scleropages formosus]
MHETACVSAGVTSELATILDILPTFTNLAGAKLPSVQLDGFDMKPILFDNGPSARKAVFYYPVDPSEKYGLFAVRVGKYKAHYYTQGSIKSSTTPDQDCGAHAFFKQHDPPLLFNLEIDSSENYNLSMADDPEYKDVLEMIQSVKKEFEMGMVFGESQMNKGRDPALEPCCTPDCSPKPSCCTC